MRVCSTPCSGAAPSGRQHAPHSRCDIEMRHKVAGRIAEEDDDFRLAVGFEERDQTIEVRHHRVGFKVDRRIG